MMPPVIGVVGSTVWIQFTTGMHRNGCGRSLVVKFSA